ncbi:MAG: hypothetical protein ACI4K7_12945 [Oscillospiraceae bacterium]
MKKIDRKTSAVIVFLISAVLFFAFTMPFRLRLAAADITEMRPVSALTPVLGLIFGLPAAAGCAVGISLRIYFRVMSYHTHL